MLNPSEIDAVVERIAKRIMSHDFLRVIVKEELTAAQQPKPRKMTRGMEAAEKYLKADFVDVLLLADGLCPFVLVRRTMYAEATESAITIRGYLSRIFDAEILAAEKRERERCKAVLLVNYPLSGKSAGEHLDAGVEG